MKKLLFGLLIVAAAGCAITDYPVIYDTRGDWTGIVRTGHKAYIIPSGQVATIWNDGTDELFTMVYQNQYGDQKLYTGNNYDPSGAIYWLDQTYCDWRWNQCEITRAWNPAPPRPDNIFDYEFFPSCPGARSLSVLVSYGSRYMGECGDGIFGIDNQQTAAGIFADLATTTWRGDTAYIVPIDASNTLVTLNGNAVPLYGNFTAFMTEKMQLAVPMTPNVRPSLSWMNDYVSENGGRVTMGLQYQDLTTEFNAFLRQDGLVYNMNR